MTSPATFRSIASPRALKRAQNVLNGPKRSFSQSPSTAFSSSSHEREKSHWTGRSGSRVPLLAISTILSSATALYFLSPSSAISLDAPSPTTRLISAQEVGQHSSKESLWVIVYDPVSGRKKVWDLTSFVERHPGGEDILVQWAGKDASKIFGPIHPKGIIERTLLSAECFIGFVDPATLPDDADIQTEDELRVEDARRNMPPLGAMVNLHDFEIEAEKVLSKTAWSYYASAGDDEYSKRENAYAYSHYWFRPSLLRRPVGVPLDLSVSLLGGQVKSRLPIYISPAAMAKLGHEEGERNLVRGAGEADILQGISINASCSLEEMIEVRKEGQPLLFQIYLDKNRKNSEALVKKVEEMGFDGLFFTIDSCVPGKRELDIRAKPVVQGGLPSKGVAGAISGYQDGNLTWDDVTWLKSLTKLPIIVKGIQSAEDVEVAAQYGASGVVLSNHGGRSLDFSPAPIDVLYELQQTNPEVFKKLDVYVDGGIRRGTDVIKALCLGAKAVGLGRPFLYGNGTYGEEGVLRVIQIMEEEISTSLRLLGCTRLDQLRPSMVRYSPREAAPRR